MRRGPFIALIALIVLASYDLSVRPQRLVESFRAMRCCAEHCQRPGNMSSAERCCGVAQDHAGLRAVDNTSPDFDGAVAVVVPGWAAATPAGPQVQVALTPRVDPSRSPPIFLSNLALLL